MQQPAPYAPPPPGFAPPGRRLNNLALISLICGVACWVALPVVGAVVAVITGHLARREIQQTGEDGAGLATIGLVSGYIHLGLGALVVIVVVIAFAALGAVLGTSASH